MWRACLAGAAFISLSAGILLARQGIVSTHDGLTFEGDITEKDDQVFVNHNGIQSAVNRANVKEIQFDANIDEEFASRLGKLKVDDSKGRIILATWAIEKKRYDLARKAAEQAADLDPNSTAAVDILELTRYQLRRQATKSAPPTTEPATPEPKPIPKISKPDKNYLTSDDINTIRQIELRPSDSRVRVILQNNVQKRFAEQPGRNASLFKAMRPFDQAIQILATNNPDMTRDIKIADDPASIREFREKIQHLVLNGCATSNCHGIAGKGGLALFHNADSEPAAYTNFYILHKYVKMVQGSQTGVFDSGMIPLYLINRTNPDRSLLLQYGLPPKFAEYTHPKVTGYTPPFISKNDTHYKQLQLWISRSLNQLDADYPIDYEIHPPEPASTLTPTSRPTAHTSR